MHKSKLNPILISILMSPVFAFNSMAQVDSESTLAEKESKGLEKILVTAQKRTQNINEVPISISTMSSDAISQTGVRQLKDVAEFVPNLTISDGTDFSSEVRIRGVGANSRNIGFDTRVGVYLDGVYLGQSPALNQELLDLERIEVLRGPQGTLFGKNTVAGAINLISKEPTDTLEGHVGAELGNLNAKQLTASLNLPLSDKLAAKFSFNKQTRDGFVTNLATGNDNINEQDATSYRAQIRYDMSENVKANLSIDGMQSDRTSYTGEPITNTFGSELTSESPELFEISSTSDPVEERDINGIALTLDWSLDNGHDVRSITAFRDSEISYSNDSDYSSLDLLYIGYNDAYEQTSQEFQYISPANSKLEYVAGLYLYSQDSETSRTVFASAISAQLFGTDPSNPTTNHGDVETTTVALFVSGDYELSEHLKLGFGVRLSTEDKKVDWVTIGTGSGAFGIATGSVIDKRTDNHIAPTVSLNYALNDELNTYIKYGNGYKSGGYNLDFIDTSTLEGGIGYDKETVDNFEVGVKGSVLDKNLSFSFAAFHAKYSDYQVNQFIDLGEGQTSISIRNAAEVETNGLEAEVTYLLTDELTLNFSAGLLDTEFVSFPGGGAGGSDASGNQLPRAPESSFNLGLQYYYPIDAFGADLLARLDYAYSDSYYTDVNNIKSQLLASGDNVAFGSVPSNSLLNARLGLISHDDDWTVSLWARNLTDEVYLTNNNRDFFGTLVNYYGTPRTFGIELEYKF
ncbi:TonB-dependent receptor [uncultured Paraglaciecola sp.]|uniref:TonB-dependent receptor n=1 Tax=uncultured Paraglaciecola sp. TaxID=1765024 RepID=UPI0030DA7B44